jgi:hypothetical protein
VAIVLLCLSSVGCGEGDDVARQAPRLAKILAGTADEVDAARAARRAGVEVEVAQRAKTEVQAGRSRLVTQLDQGVGTFTEEEYKQALEAACVASDSWQFVTADNDLDRRLIVQSQGSSTRAKTTAVVSMAKDLVEMKSGSDAEKATASLICLSVNLRYGN